MIFFFNDTATTEIYTLSLHDALPISGVEAGGGAGWGLVSRGDGRAGEHNRQLVRRERAGDSRSRRGLRQRAAWRSEEHTSELQSRQYLVCRLLLEKKKQHKSTPHSLH